ncbi:unnamed protein product [Prorocentrum cordatum]|uniref:Uncharacterized protein n=1 Tax=Prorocentrum cordatum TaxID=2364126 RepID=A0ABN9QC89_9DINO|nr:unnamed protein product [Polarella glacialis]
MAARARATHSHCCCGAQTARPKGASATQGRGLERIARDGRPIGKREKDRGVDGDDPAPRRALDRGPHLEEEEEEGGRREEGGVREPAQAVDFSRRLLPQGATVFKGNAPGGGDDTS